MKTNPIGLEGLKLVELDMYGDARGFFMERYNEKKFRDVGLPAQFVQDNHSRSAPGVLRGLHFQYEPQQGKLVGCISGKIWDVVVDVRPHSKTFLHHYGIELSDKNPNQMLWVPFGFAHGFCVLGDTPAEVIYKVDALYNPAGEAGLLWNDPELKINWPIKNPEVSERDKKLLSTSEFRQRFEK